MGSHVPSDAARRAEVLGDALLLDAYRTLYRSSDAEDALRRVDDPERPGSPYAGMDRARRRLYAPTASDADRRRWTELDEVRQAERVHVDEVVALVLARRAPAVGERDGPAPSGRGGSRRPRNGVVAAVVTATVLVVLAAVVVTHLETARNAESSVIEPPPMDGSVLLLLTNRLEPGITATSTVNWNSGYDPLQPDGFGLGIALRCRGEGRVVLRLTNGETFRFTCTDTTRTFIRKSPGAHPDALIAFVPTTGRVLWGLRIVKLPITK